MYSHNAIDDMTNCTDRGEVAASSSQQTVDFHVAHWADGTLELRASLRSRTWQLGCFLAVVAALCDAWQQRGARGALNVSASPPGKPLRASSPNLPY